MIEKQAKNCIVCKTEIQYKTKFSVFEWENKKYCSRKCTYEGRKGFIPWNPELRTSIANGRTLCRECHYQRHSKIKQDGYAQHSS